ncbi:hypothetical protein BC830DRAFT_69344 [Chytriomyces sp. MP71]|nr:hypothetical protein BC830DRAFT_69344 [Chytriomyces sp. MP71]
MQPQQPPRAIEAPRQQPQQQYQQQQNHPQPQSQSNFNQELASLRNQMTHMQHYITQLVQNQAQMNSQISQLFARNQQLVKSLTAAGSAPAPGHVLTTSPGPISPPISQNTPLDSSVVKSPPTASALTPFTMQRTSTPASTETSAAPNASVTAAGDGNNNEVPVLSDDAFDQFFQI